MLSFIIIASLCLSSTVFNHVDAATPKPDPAIQQCGEKWGLLGNLENGMMACQNYGNERYACDPKNCWLGTKPAPGTALPDITTLIQLPNCHRFQGAFRNARKIDPGNPVTIQVKSYEIDWHGGYADVKGLEITPGAPSPPEYPAGYRCYLSQGDAPKIVPNCEHCQHRRQDIW